MFLWSLPETEWLPGLRVFPQEIAQMVPRKVPNHYRKFWSPNLLNKIFDECSFLVINIWALSQTGHYFGTSFSIILWVETQDSVNCDLSSRTSSSSSEPLALQRTHMKLWLLLKSAVWEPRITGLHPKPEGDNFIMGCASFVNLTSSLASRTFLRS